MKEALTESGDAENPQNAAHINGPQRAWSKAGDPAEYSMT